MVAGSISFSANSFRDAWTAKSLDVSPSAATCRCRIPVFSAINSRSQFGNDACNSSFVSIFSGGDQFCALEEKRRRVAAGKTETYGCTGNGKNRCQIQLYAGGSEICKAQRNSCQQDNARKMKNGSKVVITKIEDDEFYCSFY